MMDMGNVVGVDRRDGHSEFQKSEKNRDRDRKETEPNDEAKGAGKLADGTIVFLGSQTKCLEDRGHSVMQVRAQQRDCENVKCGNRNAFEANDHHTVGVFLAE
jgi:hypothetical protein